MSEYIQVFTTTDSKDKAGNIARKVVEKKLAACVQITGPIISVYRWQEKINEDEEWLIIFKSRLELYDRLEREIKALHDYDVPEILAISVVNGNRDYLDWLEKETI
jgi:periplasmic divalent cation tolerance protein